MALTMPLGRRWWRNIPALVVLCAAEAFSGGVLSSIPPTVARVGKRAILRAELERRIAQSRSMDPARFDRMTEEEQKKALCRILSSMVVRELELQEARKRNIAADERVIEELLKREEKNRGGPEAFAKALAEARSSVPEWQREMREEQMIRGIEAKAGAGNDPGVRKTWLDSLRRSSQMWMWNPGREDGAGCGDLSPVSLAPARYIGSDACRICHPDIRSTFFRNPHFKSLASGKEPADQAGCESCHGPGKAHVDAHGGKTTIVAFSRLQPLQILDRCLSCHGQTFARAAIRNSPHTLRNVVCTNCHSIHKSPAPKFLLAANQTELCYDCHTDVRARFSMPFKHRVNEGFMSCTDCHNPHGESPPAWRMAARPRMMNHALANEEPCLRCHSEKRGPFVFEHGAVRVDGCEVCHEPHGSANSRLLRRPLVFTLCLECHNGASGFGRRNAGIPTQSAAHNMADSRYQNCTNCHVRIHGSNTDRLFFR
jgi:DmsE family decaheme c-type cytochrome